MADEQTTEPKYRTDSDVRYLPAPTTEQTTEPTATTAPTHVCPHCSGDITEQVTAGPGRRAWRTARAEFAASKVERDQRVTDLEQRLATVEKVLALAFSPTTKRK